MPCHCINWMLFFIIIRLSLKSFHCHNAFIVSIPNEVLKYKCSYHANYFTIYYYRFKEQRNIPHEISKWKSNWIGHILRRNCLLQRVFEGKIKGGIEVRGRRGRRRRKLLDDLKEWRGYSHLKEEALNRTMWTAHFGGGFRPVVRQNTGWMNYHINIRIVTETSLRYTKTWKWRRAYSGRNMSLKPSIIIVKVTIFIHNNSGVLISP